MYYADADADTYAEPRKTLKVEILTNGPSWSGLQSGKMNGSNSLKSVLSFCFVLATGWEKVYSVCGHVMLCYVMTQMNNNKSHSRARAQARVPSLSFCSAAREVRTLQVNVGRSIFNFESSIPSSLITDSEAFQIWSQPSRLTLITMTCIFHGIMNK